LLLGDGGWADAENLMAEPKYGSVCRRHA
jgi:hypothetical protein